MRRTQFMLRSCLPYISLCPVESYNCQWTVSEASVKRYVLYASEKCIQELLSASVEDVNDGWKGLKARRGVEVWQKFQGSSITVRGQKLTKIPPRFKAFANALDTAKRWDPYLVKGHRLKNLQENVDIVRLVFSAASGPLLRNREFIVYERREAMDDGTMVVAIASLPNKMAAGILPENNKLIRGMLLQSGWVIDGQCNPSSRVTYIAQLDPLGWLPRWLVNILSINLVMVIADLLQLADTGQDYQQDYQKEI